MASVSKRQFLQSVGGAGAAAVLSLATWQRLFAETAAMTPADLAKDDGFWESIRKRYLVTSDFIQLENGYYSLTAEPVLDSYIHHVRKINAASSFYMRTKQIDDKLAVRHELARLLGCADGELVITRNTTESLDTVIGGFDWKAGDEAVMAEQDYGSMLDMFKLQARRHGIVNRLVSVPMQPKSDDEIVAVYENAIGPKTRLLMVCHMINITGQTLPVAISAAAITTAAACTSGSVHRSAPASCTCAATASHRCGSCSAMRRFPTTISASSTTPARTRPPRTWRSATR